MKQGLPIPIVVPSVLMGLHAPAPKSQRSHPARPTENDELVVVSKSKLTIIKGPVNEVYSLEGSEEQEKACSCVASSLKD